MPRKSAGILLFRTRKGLTEVLLVHPGGPFWKNKDLGAWSIPKGELEEGEDPLEAAQRETAEELGIKVSGPFHELNPIKQKGGKLIYAWTLKQDIDVSKIVSNTFEIEWPPGSGNQKSFPEIDRAAWMSIEQAREKINNGQLGFLDELEKMLSG